jgi:NAD(P)H-flavin reductase
MKMFLLFSHKLTDEQKKDAYSLGVEEFVKLPKDLQYKWSNVPADIEKLEGYIDDFYKFLEENAKKGDYVLAQGDFGMCCKIAEFCKKNGLIAVYATTKRVAKEIQKDGKLIKISVFEHVRFRRY